MRLHSSWFALACAMVLWPCGVWALQVGDAAPNFTVDVVGGENKVALADYYGKKNVVLTTLGKGESAQGQFIALLQSSAESFADTYDAVFILVLPDAAKEHGEMAGVIVCSDPSESVSEAYGASMLSIDDQQMRQPMLCVIDKSGHVRWLRYSQRLEDVPEEASLKSALSALKRSLPLEVGASAPDFSLTEADGETVFTLSAHRDKKNVLVTLLLQTY